MKTKPRLVAGLLLAAIFACGLVAGLGLAPILHERGMPPLPFTGLGLSAEQEERGRIIIESHRGELEGVLAEVRPRVQAIHRQVRTEIDAILTPEQRQKLDALEKKHGGPHMKGGERPPPWPPR